MLEIITTVFGLIQSILIMFNKKKIEYFIY